jgi:hypothetical protein
MGSLNHNLINNEKLIKSDHEQNNDWVLYSDNLINCPQANNNLIRDKTIMSVNKTVINKLLISQNLSFVQSTPSEQKLWNLIETSEINKFLTGETNTMPEFRFSWLV